METSKEFIENSIEAYIYQRRTNSQVIYCVVLAAITIAILSLPFVYVDVSTQSSGSVRPVTERTELTSPMTEIVEKVFVKEGQWVKKGEPIIRFKSDGSNYKIGYQASLMSDYDKQLADLAFLAIGKKPMHFSSSVRCQEYNVFLKKKEEISIALEQAKREHDRNKALYDQKLISQEEYENYYFQYANKKKELGTLIETQQSTWQTDLNNMRNTLAETRASIKQEGNNKDHYTLRSPIDGYVDQFKGIYEGSSLQAGQTVAVITPRAELCIEAYVMPNDIGYMYVGMQAKVQVASFNYNEWGMVKAEVTQISSDNVSDNQGNVYYKVKCKIDSDHLTLKKTGRKGYLKNGMAVSVHFMLARHSLFELLYKKMDEMVNPAQYQQNKNV